MLHQTIAHQTMRMLQQKGQLLENPHHFGQPVQNSRSNLVETAQRKMLLRFKESGRLVAQHNWIMRSPFYGHQQNLSHWEEVINQIPAQYSAADFQNI